MSSKKAGLWTFDVAFATLQLFFVILVAVTIYFFLTMMVVKDVEIKPLELDVLSYRFLYSNNGINYVNPDIQRSYPGTIDINKFNDEQIKQFFDFKKSESFSAKLTLTDKRDKSEKVAYFNKEWFDRYKPLAFGVSGTGGAKINTKTMPVIITDSKMSFRDQGVLMIEVVSPNE